MYTVGWISVDGAGSQTMTYAAFKEARIRANEMQDETDARVWPDGTINPFGYRYFVSARGRIVYRTNPSVRPGTKAPA